MRALALLLAVLGAGVVPVGGRKAAWRQSLANAVRQYAEANAGADPHTLRQDFMEAIRTAQKVGRDFWQCPSLTFCTRHTLPPQSRNPALLRPVRLPVRLPIRLSLTLFPSMSLSLSLPLVAVAVSITWSLRARVCVCVLSDVVGCRGRAGRT